MLEFASAVRLTECLLAVALIQQSAEHLVGEAWEKCLYGLRLLLSCLLLTGLGTPWVIGALILLGIVLLWRFDGPYNGGSDRLGFLVLVCLGGAHFAPTPDWQELALAYLAVQLVLSYFVSGWVKLRNPDWRTGRALADVFAFSAYPVTEGLRDLANRPRLLWAASVGVIGFEVAFPLAVLHPLALTGALVLGGAFHLANAWLFGLNRFFWVWISAYPALFWLQGRILA